MLDPPALAGGRRRAELPIEPEEPQAVAVRGCRERIASGEERDVLLAVHLEDRRGVVRPGAGLEAPELRTGLRVVCLELPGVAADEDEAACGRRRTRVAGLGELLLPDRLPARRVDRGERAARLGPCDTGRAGDAGVGLPGLERRCRRLEADIRHGRADVDHVRLLVVAHGLPVDTALWAVAAGGVRVGCDAQSLPGD